MKPMTRALSTLALIVVLVAPTLADERADVGANNAAQAAADAIRSAAGTDGAFVAAGFLKDSFNKENLATMLQYPTDDIVVVNLSGDQIRQAFERSLSLYPQPNQSFLQISGFEVTFKKTGAPNSRIVSITANGSKLEDGKTYSVAMPSMLARGGLGYFKVWDKDKIVRTVSGTTVEDALKNKRSSESSPRWQPQG